MAVMASTTNRPRMSAAARRRQLIGRCRLGWIGFMLWTIYPLISSLYYSFTRYDLLRPPVFIGLKNYIEIFTSDPNFGQVTYNTLYYVGLSAPLGVASAFLMATLLNTEMRGRSIFRAIFFFPAIVPVVVAIMWRFRSTSSTAPSTPRCKDSACR